ncbi:14454_t:CDS:2, partial [Racocetra fulgida]
FNNSYEEVLINEFKGQIKYLELLNLLDPKDYNFFNFKFEIEFNDNISEEKAKKILEKKYGYFEELD